MESVRLRGFERDECRLLVLKVGPDAPGAAQSGSVKVEERVFCLPVAMYLLLVFRAQPSKALVVGCDTPISMSPSTPSFPGPMDLVN